MTRVRADLTTVKKLSNLIAFLNDSYYVTLNQNSAAINHQYLPGAKISFHQV